jgi:LuxR family transcriptional regulator, maltose regulon positive regulatory protein
MLSRQHLVEAVSPDNSLAIALRRPERVAPAPVAPAPAVPPSLRGGTVPRAHLLRRLTACRDKPVVLMVAPAGYGKTTLAAEWALRDERPFSWVALGDDGAADAALRAVNDARERSMPHVIVVDDAQRADAGVTRHLLDAARRFPRGTALAVLSRSAPGEPNGRLRAHRLVLEIGVRELAMTHLEAAMLFDAAGVALTAQQVEGLVERTQGWPAALYLAALAISEEPDADAAIAHFGGADRIVADYLGDELLAELPADDRSFLRRTALLRELNGPLCDAVLNVRGSAARLKRLARAGTPLQPLDRCDVAFRHHPLVNAMLRAELTRTEPELESRLHRRAAAWHARHGDPTVAIRHATAGGDVTRAGEMLWELAGGCFGDGREAMLGEWLRPFSARQLARQPALGLTSAAFHTAEGRAGRAERALDAAQLELAPAHAAGVAALRAALGRHGIATMAADAARACELAAPESPWRRFGLVLGGVAAQLAGDRTTAIAQLEEAVAGAEGGTPVAAALAHAQLALVAADACAWGDAEQHARDAQVALAVVPGARPVRALTLAVYAVAAAHRGDTAQARHDAADACRLLSCMPDPSPWLAAETHAWLARAELRLSDGPAARALLHRAACLAYQLDDAPELARWVHEGWELADAFAESATGDGPTLTNAELRVLRQLASHMTFREIGERLHVSTNTVKTQALAVYRKLDVSSRSDAVTRGRAAGLIDG